jgi:glycosyltransferase involved in cell wall biosynthesis
MKVALVTDGIWPYVLGGMQRHSYYLCKYLAKNKIEVDLIHFNQSHLDCNKLEYFTDEEKQYIHSVVIPMPSVPRFPGHYLLASYLHSKKVYKYLQTKISSYDFIYTKGFTGWYSILQKHQNKINCCKIGVKFHGYEMFQTQPDFLTAVKSFLFLRYPVKQISLKADVVFSYGGKITDIIKQIGVNPKNILELPSGVEENTLIKTVSSVNQNLRFLYLGRYERRKGIEELNTGITEILKKQITAEFHFIGPIPENKRIQHPRIVYHGEIRDKQLLTEKIQQCDVLICPSYSEGFPNVILEAMANGLCVAATPVGAVELLVNENTGWIIKNSSAGEITKTIAAILSLPSAEITNKKVKALNHIRNHFTWEKLIDDLTNSIKNNFKQYDLGKE